MYESFWQLERKPFEPTADQRDYYPSESHQGAILKLRYALENRRVAALLLGVSGVGKTMLAQTLRRQLPERCSPVAHVVFPDMHSSELVAFIADELGAPVSEPPSRAIDAVITRLEKYLSANTRSGRHAVLILDEAHLLAESGALETIRLLLNFETDGQPDLTVLLTGQSSLLPALARNTALDDRIAVKALLRPFHLEETVSYVMHRLANAGARRPIFDNAALEAIHHLTAGIPRQINRLCDLALLIGFAEELPMLTADHVHSVCQELVTVAAD